MTKVSKFWFRVQHWIEEETEDLENYPDEILKKKNTTFTAKGPNGRADFTYHYQTTTNKRTGKKSISRFYTFYAVNRKTGFRVENRITHFLPTVEQIKAACEVCGISC